MAKATGLVDKITQKTTQTGKTFYVVLINGQLYSLWAKPEFNQGDTIEFDEIIKGNFKNMASPVKLEAGVSTQGSPVQSRTFSTQRPNGSFDPDREARIVRQNATSSAISLIAASKVAGKSDVETLLAVVKETAKRIFEMNMYGYDSDIILNAEKPSGPVAQDVDALLKSF